MKLPTVLGLLNFNFSIEIEKITRTSSAKFAASNGSYLKIRIDHPNLKLQAGLETPPQSDWPPGRCVEMMLWNDVKKKWPIKMGGPYPHELFVITRYRNVLVQGHLYRGYNLTPCITDRDPPCMKMNHFQTDLAEVETCQNAPHFSDLFFKKKTTNSSC